MGETVDGWSFEVGWGWVYEVRGEVSYDLGMIVMGR